MYTMNSRKQIKIAMILKLAHASWRDFLSGFLEAAHGYPWWNLRILDPESFSPKIVDELERNDFSAVVVGDLRDDTAARLVDSPLIIELIGSQESEICRKQRNLLLVHNDDESIGRFAAEEFSRLGDFNSWAFVPADGNPQWSKLRCEGFRNALSAYGASTKTYSTKFTADSENDRLRLAKWLKVLPKPAAVFAAFDGRALNVLEACRAEKLNVPRQISIIGVDNDRLLCDFAKPTLTSIAPDHVGEGRLAAEKLVRFLGPRANRTSQTVLFSKKRIVERESTSFTPPAVALVRRAKAFIDENATQALTAGEVAAFLGVSRQLVDLRFRECESTSVAAYIRERRLFEVRQRLKAGKQSISSIARECSFANENHLRNLFKRRYGVSMRKFAAGRL